MIGDTTLSVEDQVIWELLTCKNVNTTVVITDDLKSYKAILQMTNAHFQKYVPGVTSIHHADVSLEKLFQNSFLR